MRRTNSVSQYLPLLAVVIGATAVLSGCHFGTHVPDTCGPVYVGDQATSCNPKNRAGSILAPTGDVEVMESSPLIISEQGAIIIDDSPVPPSPLSTGATQGQPTLAPPTETTLPPSGSPSDTGTLPSPMNNNAGGQ